MGFKLKTIVVVIVLTAFIIGFIYLNFYNFYAVPSSGKGEKVLVEIPKGLGLKDIALKLEEERVIRSDKLFILISFIKGASGKLKAGEYEFQIGDPIDRIMDKLINGDVVIRRITIPEGFTINDIAQLVEKNSVMSSESFIDKANSTEFAKEFFGVSLPSFEGYLFPDTYLYKKGISPEELIRMMVSRFKEVYEPLKANSGEQNLTDHEVVILASII